MPYKTIVVHVDDSVHLDARVGMAASMAIAEGAHLVGAAPTGIAKIVYDSMTADGGDSSAGRFLQIAEDRARRGLDRFEQIVRRIGVASYETRLIADEPSAGISVQGRYSDLLVLGQADPEEHSAAVYGNFPDYVALNCGCPVLIVPRVTDIAHPGENILIAWNASAESIRAVRSAIPLLQRAKQVHVAIFNPDSLANAHGEEPGADIALYLARHGIQVEVKREAAVTDVGDALTTLADGLGADLLVMGCYGHSRFREILLGGVTHSLLQSMAVPVFMSH